jgi:MoxR-like ATPase
MSGDQLRVVGQMTPEEATRFREWFDTIVENIEQVVRGKQATVRLAVQCMLGGGHLLIEDNPGTAKTTLARAMARTVNGAFSRIQFTPDLLPTDVTGVQIYNAERRQFDFRPGPVFANIVLADEINRASPKTQSALLEAMAEQQTTVDGETHRMPQPFLVIATQNPVEMEGTYPLPEAQLDRFMARTSIGYPDRADEMQIIRDGLRRAGPDSLEPVISAAELQQMIDFGRGVSISDGLVEYLAKLGERTRVEDELRLGASPRAVVALAQLAQVRAASVGRHYVTPDDIKGLAHAVLAHRMLLRPEAAIQGHTAGTVLDRILDSVSPPRERSSSDGWSR